MILGAISKNFKQRIIRKWAPIAKIQLVNRKISAFFTQPHRSAADFAQYFNFCSEIQTIKESAIKGQIKATNLI